MIVVDFSVLEAPEKVGVLSAAGQRDKNDKNPPREVRNYNNTVITS